MNVRSGNRTPEISSYRGAGVPVVIGEARWGTAVNCSEEDVLSWRTLSSGSSCCALAMASKSICVGSCVLLTVARESASAALCFHSHDEYQ